jgi:hypothetical protein
MLLHTQRELEQFRGQLARFHRECGPLNGRRLRWAAPLHISRREAARHHTRHTAILVAGVVAAQGSQTNGRWIFAADAGSLHILSPSPSAM